MSKLAAFTVELIGDTIPNPQPALLELRDDGKITNPNIVKWKNVTGQVIGVAVSNDLIRMRVELKFHQVFNLTGVDVFRIEPRWIVIELKSGQLSDFLFDYINDHALTVEQLKNEYTID